jgi:predicted metal-dependent hydrolase
VADPRIEVRGGTLDLNSRQAPFLLRRNSRARLYSLKVDPRRGAVTLVLPSRGTREEGLRFLARSAAWIEKRLDNLPPRTPFADGAAIPLKGREFKLRHDPAHLPGVWPGNGEIVVGGSSAGMARRLGRWLVAEARREFTTRAHVLAEKVGRRIAAIRVADTRSQWGACSSSGRISFSWRVIMAPDMVIDYLVAHEVAHLIHRGHGPRFKALLARLAPAVDSAEEWLKRHGPALYRIG